MLPFTVVPTGRGRPRRKGDWTDTVAPGTELEVRVKSPETRHVSSALARGIQSFEQPRQVVVDIEAARRRPVRAPKNSR